MSESCARHCHLRPGLGAMMAIWACAARGTTRSMRQSIAKAKAPQEMFHYGMRLHIPVTATRTRSSACWRSYTGREESPDGVLCHPDGMRGPCQVFAVEAW